MTHPAQRIPASTLLCFQMMARCIVLLAAPAGCRDDGYDAAMKVESLPAESAFIFSDLPPVPGNGGIITTGAVDPNRVQLLWTRARDDRTDQAYLEYCVYGSTGNDISTYMRALANGFMVYGWDTDCIAAIAEGLDPATTYYFCVFVRDGGGSIAAYHTIAITTPAGNFAR